MANKELKKLLKSLEAQGWRVERRKKGWMAYPPDTDQTMGVGHPALLPAFHSPALGFE